MRRGRRAAQRGRPPSLYTPAHRPRSARARCPPHRPAAAAPSPSASRPLRERKPVTRAARPTASPHPGRGTRDHAARRVSAMSACRRMPRTRTRTSNWGEGKSAHASLPCADRARLVARCPLREGALTCIERAGTRTHGHPRVDTDPPLPRHGAPPAPARSHPRARRRRCRLRPWRVLDPRLARARHRTADTAPGAREYAPPVRKLETRRVVRAVGRRCFAYRCDDANPPRRPPSRKVADSGCKSESLARTCLPVHTVPPRVRSALVRPSRPCTNLPEYILFVCVHVCASQRRPVCLCRRRPPYKLSPAKLSHLPELTTRRFSHLRSKHGVRGAPSLNSISRYARVIPGASHAAASHADGAATPCKLAVVMSATRRLRRELPAVLLATVSRPPSALPGQSISAARRPPL